ncbi:MAG: O-antigen ligase family protein [bacterium]
MKLFIYLTFYFIGFGYYFYKHKPRRWKDMLYISVMLFMISTFNYPALIQYGIRILALGLSVISLTKTLRVLKKSNIAFITIIYILLCLFSTIYSVNRLETFVKSLEMFILLLCIWSLFSIEDKKIVINKLFNHIIYIAILQLIIMVFGYIFNNHNFSSVTNNILPISQLKGGYLGANMTAAMAILPFIWALHKKKSQKKYIIIVFCLSVMLLAQSRTSVFITGILVIVGFFNTKRKYLYVIGFCIGIYFIYHYQDTIMLYILRGQNIDQFSNMSGRKTMWALAQSYIEQRPLLGYGFGAGGYIVSSQHYGMSTLHSAFYETLMGVGWIGLSLLVLQVFFAGFKILIHILRYGLKFCTFEVMIYIYLLARSYTGVSIGSWVSIELVLWYIFIFSLEYLPKNLSLNSLIKIDRL